MSSTATSPPASDADPAYDTGRVTRLRLLVTARRPGSADPDEGLVVDVQPASTAKRWDEKPYVDLLLPVLHEAGDGHRVRHRWRVEREQGTETGTDPDAVVALHLVLPAGPRGRAELPLETVRSALQSVVTDTTSPAPEELTHEASLAAATRYAAVVAPVTSVGALQVADEEHRHAAGVWAVGLVASDGSRLDVEVGGIDGRASSAHVLRYHPEEVVDSVGVS